MKIEIHTTKAPAAIGPYSQAIRVGNLVYSSGQIALNPDNGLMNNDSIETETHQVMKNIQALLQEVGIGWQNIIKTSIFLQNMSDFEKVNNIYATYVVEPYPARETIQVARLPKDAAIEISFVAYID